MHKYLWYVVREAALTQDQDFNFSPFILIRESELTIEPAVSHGRSEAVTMLLSGSWSDHQVGVLGPCHTHRPPSLRSWVPVRRRIHNQSSKIKENPARFPHEEQRNGLSTDNPSAL